MCNRQGPPSSIPASRPGNPDRPLDAAPATLLAVCAWLRGDGAMANVALARALDSDPAYTLARLLAQALARCVPPAELRTMIAGTLPRHRRPGR